MLDCGLEDSGMVMRSEGEFGEMEVLDTNGCAFELSPYY